MSTTALDRTAPSAAPADSRWRVALVTYAQLPSLSDDDRLVLPELGRLGVRAEPATWNDPGVRWSHFDGVVLRSCWDYHLASDDFHRWIEDLEHAGVPMFNPPRVLRWNASKTYLRELAERGVDVVPTRWVEQGSDIALATVMEEEGWSEVVIKGSVSASAHDTWLVPMHGAALREPDFRRLVERGPVLVQPFIESIGRDGEWSLLFFGGEFSHAVIKRPKAGDFRVQTNFGGSYELAVESEELQAQARAALVAAPEMCVYARVDGCVEAGRLRLMELELLEPDVFLRLDSRAPARFAEAIVAALVSSARPRRSFDR